MAIQAVGAASVLATPPSSRTARTGGTQPNANTADANVVVSKVTRVNADGSVTTITTYADGHTETQTTPATQAAAAQPNANGAAPRGSNLNLLV
jgi:hypothetical protein